MKDWSSWLEIERMLKQFKHKWLQSYVHQTSGGFALTRALMLVMAANVVKEFGIMHLVSRHETYKIISSIITQALGKITNISVTVGKVVCEWFSLLLTLTVMTFF